MSAFLVEDDSINGIIAWLGSIADTNDRGYIFSPLRALGFNGRSESLGRAMFELNRKSLIERYGEDIEEANAVYTFKIVPAGYLGSSVQVYKSLQCFLYQSCEGSCDQNPLCLALHAISAYLAHYIVQRLPEWQAAKWR
jgi:hypothetical protein